MRAPRTPKYSEDAVRLILKRYECPTPFAAARALFMGAIASPVLGVSPMGAVTALWKGELPQFESAGDVEVLAKTLIDGLWNRLIRHQSSREPFRLIREQVFVTHEGLLGLAKMRAQELGGFLDGLFGGAEQLDLPEKARQSMTRLIEMHGAFEASAALLGDDTMPASSDDLAQYARNAQAMTLISDELINKIIQSCKRARAGHLQVQSSQTAPTGAGGQGVDEPPLVESPLSQSVTRQGVAVQVEIYGDGEDRWILEIVDRSGTSHVWDDHFDTDQDALDEAIRALEEDPMEFAGDPSGGTAVH